MRSLRSRIPAALLATLTLVLGGATLAACDSAPDSGTGTVSNDPADRSGNDPSGVSQGDLPDLDAPSPGSDRGDVEKDDD
ncbi:hypothetical protein [Modestobacter sp. NPDC049651]|uniref:hypothetical protein n=1 Tax=unclassified Modestobacter TaxID=2643866 RepID=UPI0033DCE059